MVQSEKRDVLDIAKEITSGSRQEAHGPPERSLENIAKLWTAYLGVNLKPEDVAFLMILLKVARGATKLTENDPVPRDNWIDIAGYARLGDLVG